MRISIESIGQSKWGSALTVLTSVVALLMVTFVVGMGGTVPRVVATNMANVGAPCAMAYYLLHRFVFRGVISKKRWHLLTYPASTLITALILFGYWATHRSELRGALAMDIASVPLYISCAAGAALALVGAWTIKKMGTNSRG
jgi:hypothetical protein